MLRNLINGIVDLVYPKTCVACKRNLKGVSSIDGLVCGECWDKIKKNLPPFCSRCGRHLEKNNLTKNICAACIRTPLNFDRAFSPCKYEGALKELIHAFKYEGKDYLGPILSKFMTEFITEYGLPIEYLDLLIPVPLHKIRMREREFNQAQILANCIAERFNKKLSNDVLLRHRPTKTQTELEPQERFLNIKGSFSVTDKENIKNKNILLIDDVLTTGATSSEAAYALKNAQANIVFVLTLAN